MSRSQRHLRQVLGKDSSGNTKGSVTNDPKVPTRPTVAGTPTNGSTLTGTNGTFSGPSRGGTITITRQWVREVVATGAQTVIAGQTGATYVLQAADVGKRIRLQNTATNKYGSLISQSLPTATIT